jgi:hypothetical protein
MMKAGCDHAITVTIMLGSQIQIVVTMSALGRNETVGVVKTRKRLEASGMMWAKEDQ